MGNNLIKHNMASKPNLSDFRTNASGGFFFCVCYDKHLCWRHIRYITNGLNNPSFFISIISFIHFFILLLSIFQINVQNEKTFSLLFIQKSGVSTFMLTSSELLLVYEFIGIWNRNFRPAMPRSEQQQTSYFFVGESNNQ